MTTAGSFAQLSANHLNELMKMAYASLLSGQNPDGTVFSGAVNNVNNFDNVNLLAAGEETIPRWEAATANVFALSSQVLRLTYFTARKTESITQVRVPSGGTAQTAATLCRVGVYSIDGAGAGTLVASTANDTALWLAANTDYLKAFQATFNKVAGQRYAFGELCVTAGTAPQQPGAFVMGAGVPGANAAARAPRLAGSLTAQADLPNSYADASLATLGGLLYAELVP